MTNILRMTAAVAALALASTPAVAAPVQPDKQATATARIVKPLTLTWLDDLDLGTITLVNNAGATVGISRGGTFSCPAPNVTCTGTPKVARYNITGVNNAVVTVNVGNVSMVHETDLTKTLLLNVDGPGTVTLTNAGAPGTDFSIGGNIAVSGTTLDGRYTGTFAVTVNY